MKQAVGPAGKGVCITCTKNVNKVEMSYMYILLLSHESDSDKDSAVGYQSCKGKNIELGFGLA